MERLELDAVHHHSEAARASDDDARCLLCAVGSQRGSDGTFVENSVAMGSQPRGAVVLFARDGDEVEVVPAAHVSRLSALSSAEMAHVLAALRRVALIQRPKGSVQLRAVDLRGSRGHVCIRVGPASGGEVLNPDGRVGSAGAREPARQRPS